MTTKTPTVRPELLLSHWMTPQRRLRLDAAVLDGAPDRLADPGEIMDRPDEMATFAAVMATEDPWMLRLWSYDRDKREYAARWTKLRLRINPRTVSAQLKTPAGVPVMWNHMTWAYGALGRVLTMRAENKRLVGEIGLSNNALAVWGASLEQIDAGLTTGLSVGMMVYDPPKRKSADGDTAGTYDNPDELVYGRVQVSEVSLTATPMIAQAGLMGRKEQGD